MVAKGGSAKDLKALDAYSSGFRHVIGHNILRHDLPHLMAVSPEFSKLAEAPIDTLWLNPLAFPRNPYHHLVKHYQDGRLETGRINDPEQDARLVFEVLDNQLRALRQLNDQRPDTLIAYHYLCGRGPRDAGFERVFATIRNADAPRQDQAQQAIRRLLDTQACQAQVDRLLVRLDDISLSWPTAFALAWVSVAGGDSVMPPWVRWSFRDAAQIVRDLRDTNCGDPNCAWCAENNDAGRALKRWFGFDAFRPEPADAAGQPLQEKIVQSAMAGDSLLGILPTGTGKSICYQIPALSRFDKTGALTVVISPLVALMADQVQGMARAGIGSAVSINGLLSLPERYDALDKVRLGDASILLISPEQLRSPSVRSVLKQREIGLWVLDEAHCVSKWGHDFRPDYRYVSRFIKENAFDETPPVLCLTATAKPDVVADIQSHFKDRLNLMLTLLDGGAARTNLRFEVSQTTANTKLADVMAAIDDGLPRGGRSGAIVYCASRAGTERVADYLKAQGLTAAHFHAGMSADEKAQTQDAFRTGALRVIAATSAFGMGIDKPDIRLVVHADIPGSLENYLQEAGRAGRDRDAARCILLFDREDVDRQFRLSARSQLERHEIRAILRAIRNLDKSDAHKGEVVATTGEIVRAEKDREFGRDGDTQDTRVKTAVAWLEEATLLRREENRVQVFPASLKVRSLGEVKQILDRQGITHAARRQLYSIVNHIINSSAEHGVSTDDLSLACGLSGAALRKALNDLESLGIASNDTKITIYIHWGTANASTARLDHATALEVDVIDLMRQSAPDATVDGDAVPLSLPHMCQALRDMGHQGVRPDMVDALLRGLAQDGRDDDTPMGSISLRRLSKTTVTVTLNRSWGGIKKVAALRRTGAARILDHLIDTLPTRERGNDQPVDTTLGALLASITGDALLVGDIRDPNRLMDRALIWLHEQQVVALGKGLSVFRPAMTLHLNPAGGPFTREHYAPLDQHYTEQTLQTHVMAAYAQEGLADMSRAMRLADDYFGKDEEVFLRDWLPGRTKELARRALPEIHHDIVGALGSDAQERIVRDNREQTNVLVLAAPGSGKTRVLVHRIAYLVKIRREDPSGILVLAYNRHSAAEIKDRLLRLIGPEARYITVQTIHALAMRLVGASFAGQAGDDLPDFSSLLHEATALLRGDGLDKRAGEALRDTLVQGYRWLLVDEYQDVGPDEYALIAAVAGRSLEDRDLRISLFAVGDDDQNIYSFNGASVRYIRQFEDDYSAKPDYLIENYRSSGHIIAAANAVIEGSARRMKAGQSITVDEARRLDPPGGEMADRDPVAQGRVQVLSCPVGDEAQAMAALDELRRLAQLNPDFRWSRAAVIARKWSRLNPVRDFAESLGIPVEFANDKLPGLWRMREMQHLVRSLKSWPKPSVSVADLVAIIGALPPTRWTNLLNESVGVLARDLGDKTIPAADAVEWFAEWSRQAWTEQRGLKLLTAHGAKGLEFDDVVILDGDWERPSKNEDPDAPRRLFYVAMTRARRSLAVMSNDHHDYLPQAAPSVLTRRVTPDLTAVPGPRRFFQSADLKLVDLGYAGRLRATDASLAAIADAKAGDPVDLVLVNGKWQIQDSQGRVLGRMARRFQPPARTRFARGEISAIFQRRKDDGSDTFHHVLARDEWEVVVPDIVFEAL
ncbi:MAG: RecQ family ATP-dependent DNA helicase [Marinibacterium sp.]|nr:RecQ family ATP-dependent DNA helicase [Marinibacterium sp.]